jgi:tripartite-type tricarboxylate transporter receptor subunit TctC
VTRAPSFACSGARIAVLAKADLRKRFTELGGSVVPFTPAAFGQHIASEIANWKKSRRRLFEL